MNLIISEYNYTLRRIARDKIGLSGRFNLPYDVEYSLSKLFERELELVRNAESMLRDINGRYDFNTYDLFTSMQGYSSLTGDK